MNFRLLNSGILLIATLTIAGCMSSNEATVTNASDSSPSNWKPQKGLITFNYSANAKVYQIRTKYDGALRSYGTELKVLSGSPLVGDDSEDAEAQNTIRDAFRAQGLCGEDLHPGILAFNYGYFENLGAWAAQVRCSKVAQSNI